MGQQEVYNLLKKENRWMTSKEIGDKLNQQRATIAKHCRKLKKWNEIIVKKIKMEGGYNYENIYKIK